MRRLAPAAQEERRRQVIGLRQRGMTYQAIADQLGLSRTGVFNICQRFAREGPSGLKSKPHGPEPGQGRVLSARQEAAMRKLICLRQDYPAIVARAKHKVGGPFAKFENRPHRRFMEAQPIRRGLSDMPGLVSKSRCAVLAAPD